MARGGAAWGAALLLVLAGCGGHKPAETNASEAARLNEAADMTDTSPDSLAAPDNMAVEGESAPANGNAP